MGRDGTGLRGPRGARRTALRREFVRSVARSKGRFLSIVGLMALGSFALVGLLVAGPDMRATARAYFDEQGLADVTVVSDLGLDADDVAAIDAAPGARDIEYGYFKDVTIEGTTTSLRVMSAPEGLSQFELVDGRMPAAPGEIALDSALADAYALGDAIEVDEKPETISQKTVLTSNEFTVVGFVNSCEIISTINMGESTAGTGSLGGYAVVTPEAFDADYYMTARLSFDDTAGLDPYGDEYRDLVRAHEDDLEELLAERPAGRLATVRDEAQATIDDGQAELDDARDQLADTKEQLADAASQIDDAQAQIDAARGELSAQTAAGRAELADAQAQLDDAAAQIAQARSELEAAAAQIADGEAQIDAARSQLEAGEGAYAEAAAQLDAARSELEASQAAYDEKNTQLAAAKQAYDEQWPDVSARWEDAGTQTLWSALDARRDEIAAGIAQCEQGLAADPGNEGLGAQLARWQELQGSLDQLDELRAGYERLAAFGASYEGSVAKLEAAAAQLEDARASLSSGEAQLAERRALLDRSAAELSARQAQLDEARAAYQEGAASLDASVAAYEEGVAAYRAGEGELARATSLAEGQIASAESELSARSEEYRGALEEYESALPDAEAQIADAEADLADARERVDGLSAPAYSVYSRREAPWSRAYSTYETISEVIDSLARVFPVFLYLVAALVTLTTMTRMVEEDRVVSGTLKALGYSDADVARKFVAYGALAGGAGAVLGTALGHTLLPMIVYGAYGHAFTLPPLRLAFYPGVSVLALALAALCSVVPAWAAARRELRARPAELLLPKAPRGGSRIALERVRPVWGRLSFIGKVTARNLFRYKQRMLMTVLGVAGAVAILVTGFGVQASIQQMATRQFGTIIRYDMIVATSASATASEEGELEDLLGDPMVASHAAVHYESVSKVAGESGDRQDITLLVPQDPSSFSAYVSLAERGSDEPIDLGAGGAVISERLAQLLGVGVGDVVEVTDAAGEERSVTVSGVTEMYMGHFMFLSPEAYEEAFGTAFEPNASLVVLADGSTGGVEAAAARFMGLGAVRGVVQNTALQSQVDTIVNSLDKIMGVLIVVASMLGVVIMYNLTNLNVSERMRELSTIKVLGFFNNETTMYIYRETIILTAIGVLVGFAVGVALHEYVLWVVPPDNAMFDPALSPVEFVVPVVVTAAITLALYFVVLRRLRRVDMLEALKSVD